MAVVTKTFAFATDTEGYVGVPASNNVTMVWDSLGNPGGSLRAGTTNKNVTAAESYWEYAGTWEALGVPAGSTVTSVRLMGASTRCASRSAKATSTIIGPYRIHDNAGTQIGVLWSGRTASAAETSWTVTPAQTSINIPSGSQASNSTVRIRLADTIGTSGGGGTANEALHDDQVSIEITYTAPTIPSAPTGLSATAISWSQINLAWTATSGAASYNVERSANGSIGWTSVGTPTTNSFSDTGLSGNTTYYYRVSATNVAGTSAPSGTASTTTLAPPPLTETLTDDFSTKNTAKWQWLSGTPDPTGGYQPIPAINPYGEVRSVATDLVLSGSHVYVNLAQKPNTGNGSVEAILRWVRGSDYNNRYELGWSGGQWWTREMVGGVDSMTFTSGDSGHSWMRIRMDANAAQVYWETSADGVTWEIRRQKAPGIANPGDGGYVSITAGNWNLEPTPGEARFDNFNMQAVVAEEVVKSASDTSSISITEDAPVIVKATPPPVVMTENTFEGGTDGTAITQQNSGGVSGTAFAGVALAGGATFNYSTAAAQRGTMGGRVIGPATGSVTTSLPINTVSTAASGRVGFTVRSFDYSGPVHIARFRDTSFTTARAIINNSGVIQFQDASGASLGTSNVTVELNTRYWLRVTVNGTAVTVQVLSDNGTVLWTNNATMSAAMEVTHAVFGKLTTAPALDIDFDDVAVQNDSSLIPIFSVENKTASDTIPLMVYETSTVPGQGDYLDTYNDSYGATSTVTPTAKTGTDTASLTVTDNRTLVSSSTRTDTAAISVSDNATLFKTITASDTGAVTVTETVAARDVSVPGNDSAALGVTEQASILVTTSRTDTAAITVTETRSQGVSLSRTETAALSVTDTRTTAVSISRTDTASVAVSDGAGMFITKSASDSIALTSTETAGKGEDSLIPGNDSGALGVTEQASIFVTSSTSDSATLGVTDNRSTAVGVSSTDTGSLSVADNTNNAVRTTVTDSATLSVNETSSIFKAIAVSDTASLGVVEISNTGGNATAIGNDSVSVGVSEQVTISVTFSATDASALSVTDARQQFITRPLTDAAALSVSDSASVLIQISRTDGAILSVSDSSSSFRAHNAIDSASITVSDTGQTTKSIVASDTASLSVTEISGQGGDGAPVGSETTTLGVTEQVSIAVTTSASDTGSIAVNDARTILVSQSRPDTLTVGLTETRTQSVGLSRTDTAGLRSTENVATRVIITRTDGIPLSVTETRHILLALSANDNIALAVSESLDTGEVSANVMVYTGGQWRAGRFMVFTNGQWKEAQLRVFKSGVWA